MRPARPRTRRLVRRLTVQGWLLVSLAVAAVLALASLLTGTMVLAHTTAASDRLVGRIAPARTASAQWEASLTSQDDGLRAYLRTGDRDLLQPYTRGMADQARAGGRLAALMGDDPRTAADLAAVRRDTDAWRSRFATPAIAARRAGAATVPDRGGPAFDLVRRDLAAADGHLALADAEARHHLARARTQRDLAFGSMFAVFVLTCGGLALVLRLGVVGPLDAMRAAAYQVADGAFEQRIPERGPADLRAMARAAESMRRRVVAELAASRTAGGQLRDQAAAMEEQAVELRRSNAELEQFAYVASHDLQEPLRKVASFCQLLERRYGPSLDERGLQYIDFAVDGAKRMQILINDLLTFSRVGRLHDAWATVALDDSVDTALGNLAAALEDTGAVIERPAELPQVVGDPLLLSMLWQNLLGNAVKFRHPDRVPRVRITAEAEPDDPSMRRLTVADNGIGIPAEFADKVFVIFQRLHGRDAYEGTGIGLALCKKIVENGGGRIWLDTGHSPGTRLHFTLPSAEPAAGPEPPPQPATDSAAGTGPATPAAPGPEGIRP